MQGGFRLKEQGPDNNHGFRGALDDPGNIVGQSTGVNIGELILDMIWKIKFSSYEHKIPKIIWGASCARIPQIGPKISSPILTPKDITKII
jgi:hypothetical protein